MGKTEKYVMIFAFLMWMSAAFIAGMSFQKFTLTPFIDKTSFSMGCLEGEIKVLEDLAKTLKGEEVNPKTCDQSYEEALKRTK